MNNMYFRRAAFTALIAAGALVMVLMIVESAYAVDIDGGTCHGVPWRITSEGELLIGAEGQNTQFTGISDRGKSGESEYYFFPWCAEPNNASIKKVRFLGTVSAEAGADLNYMFLYLPNCTSIDLRNFKVGEVGYMNHMFAYDESLKTLNMTGFTPKHMDSLDYMFIRCQSLEKLDLSGFDTSGTEPLIMWYMFDQCSSLKTLDLSGFDTSRVTEMMAMFSNCYSLESVDVSSFDTSNVESLGHMFSNCLSLKKIDLSSFRTSKVESIAGMFNKCYLLKELDMSGFDLSSLEADYYGTANVFNECRLRTLYTPYNLSSECSIDLPYAMVDGQGGEYTKLPTGTSRSVKLTCKTPPEKFDNPFYLYTTSVTYKQSKLKKAATFKIRVENAVGKVTYTLNSAAKKAKIKVTSKGKVTVPKKCKKGTYKITVKAAGDEDYKAAKGTVTIKVK